MTPAVPEKANRNCNAGPDSPTFDLSDRKEKQQEATSDEQHSFPAQHRLRERGFRHIARYVALLVAAGYLLYVHPDNYLSKRISEGVTSLSEWRHHPYTLPEFYSLCTREGRGIYTSDPEAEWAQCVTVQQGKIVDVGDLGEYQSVICMRVLMYFPVLQLMSRRKCGTSTESTTRLCQG
jgi:hypothetical protein